LSEIRAYAFKKNAALEEMLTSVNDDLGPSEQLLRSKYLDREMNFPLILVLGPLRSGTTLFMQWLAETGIVSYPTNLLSRFYKAPTIGAKIQLLLTDRRYNFRDELGEFLNESSLESENGKTKGALAPNEFWYYWRQFLEEPSRDVWTDEELHRTVQIRQMIASLAAMMDVFAKPFAAKGMLFNYNIKFLDSVFEKLILVRLKRDPVATVASVLRARERQYGHQNAWYSFEIPEKRELSAFTPLEQASGQISCINRALDRGLAKVDEHRKLTVEYEEFCENPGRVFSVLRTRLESQGYSSCAKYTGAPSFVARNRIDLSKAEVRKIWKVYSDYSN